MTAMNATTMSVRETGALLGLKKTESYYLLHKHYFETIVVNKKVRVIIASFEKWYENQDRYRKVDGAEPGTVLRTKSLSRADIGAMLNLDPDSVGELIKKANLPTFRHDGKLRVPRDAYDRWYASQTQYLNIEDQEKNKAAYEASMTIPEMGRILGLNRREAWLLYAKISNALIQVKIDKRPRITKSSFEKWYNSRGKLLLGYHPAQVLGLETVQNLSHVTKPEPWKIDLSKNYFSIAEVASLVSIPERDLYRMISRKVICAKKIGRKWYIANEALLEMMETEKE